MGETSFCCQFDGPPCFRHSNYVFYKAFKYKCDYQDRALCLGDFFLMKILPELAVCVGEVELLWEDRASRQYLSSLRLYFRPEHTPGGRHDDTGEDEVVALGERLVLRLDDLAPLIQHGIRWTYGCSIYSPKGTKSMDVQDSCEKVLKRLRNCGHNVGHEEGRNGISDGQGRIRNLGSDHVETDSLTTKSDTSSGAANLAVMSYPRYCRYRAVQKRLEGCDSEWLHLAVVVAVGGFSGKTPGCRVMFCRDTFYQAEIDDLDIRMDHMLPVLKGRSKGKKNRQLSQKDSQQDSDSTEEMFANVTPSVSSSSRPRRLTESSEINEEKVSTAEQAFLIGLHKFMHDTQMPIGRIPSLGFKQIDLYYFYRQAQRLGGYDSISHKRMWKNLYDKLGGNSSNTSAATCTRKHYERLLLPYERHLCKLKVGKGKKRHQKRTDSQNGDTRTKMGSDNIVPSITKDVFGVEPESGDTQQVLEQDNKENVRQTLSESSQNCHRESSQNCQQESSQNCQHESSQNCQGGNIQNCRHQSSSCEKPVPNVIKSVPNVTKLVPNVTNPLPSVTNPLPSVTNPLPSVTKSLPSVTEHSRPDIQEESDLFEIPLVRSSVHSSSALPSVTLTNLDKSSNKQHLSVSPTEQQTQPERSSVCLTSAMPSNTLMLPESPALPYASMMYTGGYLVPVLPHHMMHTPWGMMPSPSSLTSASSPQARADGSTPQPVNHFKDHSNTSLILSSKASQDSIQDNHNKPSTKTASLPSLLGEDTQKAAHTNTPYQPSPYLLNNHIQPILRASHSSSHHLSSSEPHVNSSHHLAPVLHPIPPGHRSQSHLPPAPSTIYLHPSSTSQFSQFQPSLVSSPPSAHCHPRKRVYPYESPTHTSTRHFPSPDMVLDRIRNSTGLPCSNALSSIPPIIQQRFEDPRQIFQQTLRSVADSQSVSLSQKKEQHFNQEFTSSKSSSIKSKSSKKFRQTYTNYSHVSSPELQHALMQGQGQRRHINNSRVVDQTKASSNLNGAHSSHQTSKSVTCGPPASPAPSSSKSVTCGPPASPAPSSSKDGRLMSALFGTQFTALPRVNKPSDLTPASSLMADPSVAAMSLNPHLHPAFMSPYQPAGGPAAVSAVSPQLQMLASSLAPQAQLAAYEEMLRHNGCSPFITATAPGKMSKKS